MNSHHQNYGWQKVYKVLIIEDSEADFELYQSFLRKDKFYNYIIEYAETGAEGLELCSTYNPDFVIIDFSLPDMDGLELLESIKKLHKSSLIPIIMITAYGNQEIALQAMKRHINDYLIKDDLDFQKFITGVYGLITSMNNHQSDYLNQSIDILIVDDVDTDIELYKRFIQQDTEYSFNIYTANTGLGALDFLQNQKIDLLLTDYKLPDMSGMDLISSFRQFSISENTCIILMTGQGNEQLVVEAMKNGVSDYCVKQNITPFKLRKLIKDNLTNHKLSTQFKKIQLQKSLIAKIGASIRSSLDLDNIIQAAVLEVKKYLDCDRVIMYELNEVGIGRVVGESVNPPFKSLLGSTIKDTFLQDNINRREYVDNSRKQIINDIENATINPCHRKLLEKFQVKAIVSVPIIIHNLPHPLWGLLIIHYCRKPHKWKQIEINFLTEIGLQIAIGIQQGLLVKELTKERDRANEATQAKSIFLANMSHEIRTPMNGVLGMAEILSLSNLNPEQADYVKTIQDSGKHLLALINDILDLSKLEAGKIELKPRKFSLRKDIINHITQLLAIPITEKNLDFNIDIATDLPDIYLGDAERLMQILINLISNAVKFTSQGKIKVIVHQLQSQSHLLPDEIEIYCAIKDTGIGIAQADQNNLFKPFSQVENVTTRQFGGTGLGLYICKKLVNLMGGEIGVQSIVNQGSKFWFTVKLQYLNPTSLPSNHIQTSTDYIPEKEIKQVEILVAEDNIVNQKVVKNQLKKIGYSCDIVPNGEEVLKSIHKKSYNLIFMDCQMPILDGYETTKKIRSEENPQDLVIIGLSAFAMTDDLQKCLNAGMDDYLSKPCKIDSLQQMIAKWMQN